MSKIEEALQNAIRLRGIKDVQTHGRLSEEKGDTDAGINILVISRDQGALRLITHLQPLLNGEIIPAGDIVQGMKSLFDKLPLEIDDQELKFAASMLDSLCCCRLGA
jgi:hypothetical protein